MREQNGDSPSIMTFASHSISCSSPQTHLSGAAFSTGAALNGVTWQVGSSHTIFAGGNKRVGGNTIFTGQYLIELFCISANLVQNPYDGKCSRRWKWKFLPIVVNTRTFELLKDLNLMQENRMISEMSYLFLTILQPFWKYIQGHCFCSTPCFESQIKHIQYKKKQHRRTYCHHLLYKLQVRKKRSVCHRKDFISLHVI